jgi:hypothetical protein
MKQTWLDVYLGRYKWYRKLRGGKWYLHQFTVDAEQLTFEAGKCWWARYATQNKYSIVVGEEDYKP